MIRYVSLKMDWRVLSRFIGQCWPLRHGVNVTKTAPTSKNSAQAEVDSWCEKTHNRTKKILVTGILIAKLYVALF